MFLNALSKHTHFYETSREPPITDTKKHVERKLYVVVRDRIQVFCTNQTPINLAFYKESWPNTFFSKFLKFPVESYQG